MDSPFRGRDKAVIDFKYFVRDKVSPMEEKDVFGGIENDLNHKIKEELLMSELQLLFAEKRTSLSVLRTGIAVLSLPLSVLTVLVATSRYYSILDPNTLPLAIPLMILAVVLIGLGAALIIRSYRNIRKYDKKIAKIRKEDRELDELTENC